MTVVAVVFVPVVLLYQGWTYWVFRHRLGARGLTTCAVRSTCSTGRSAAAAAGAAGTDPQPAQPPSG